MTEKAVTLAPSFVLSWRPYRETSAILNIFSQHFGRLSVLAKGIRRKNSKLQLALQLFQPLQLSWVGRSELKTLTQVEPAGQGCWLQGALTYTGLYLNELLLKVLKPWDPHPELFVAYRMLLPRLPLLSIEEGALELALRVFELGLLAELGYGLTLSDVQPQCEYGFDEKLGCFNISDESHCANNAVYQGARITGAALQALVEQNLSDRSVRVSIKRWMRYVFQVLMGGEALTVRTMLLQPLR